MFRGLNWVMCALFLLAVVVQWNDPDPLLWVAIYGAALVVSSVVAWRGRIAWTVPAVVAAVAMCWSLARIIGGPAASQYSHMFDAWEMKSVSVEEAREATGLLIVAAWMTVIAARQRRGGK